MKRILSICAGAVVAGLGLGILEAAKWLHALSAPDTLWHSAFSTVQQIVWLPAFLVTTGLLFVGYTIVGNIAIYNKAGVLAKAAIATILALVAFWAVITLSTVFYLAPFVYIPTFAAVLAFCTTLLFHIFTPPWLRDYRLSASRGLIVAIGWAVFILILRISLDKGGNLSFGGLRTFSALAYPPELRSYPYLLSDLAGGLLCGMFFGAAVSWAVKGGLISGAVRGGALGAWVSGAFYASHASIGTYIMQSAYSERSAVYSSLVLIPLAGIVAALGLITVIPGFANGKQKTVSVILGVLLLSGAAFYVSDSRNGANFYVSAIKAHSFRTRTYIHFTGDGGWRRTYEPHDDTHKIMLCDRLLKKNPRSIYAAHALYLKARCQYSSWMFGDAEKSLEFLLSRYSDYHGSASVLLAHSYLSQGYYEKAVQRSGSSDPVFARWRSGEGGLVLGHAYEVMGREQDALGQYTYYLVKLTGSKQSSWASHAVQYAESRADKVRAPSIITVPRAVVKGRIISSDGPLSGIHLALVHPHIDASSPDNTMQFSSALTVPLWFGLGATTDSQGVFEIRNVPYGDYEVVVGFDTQNIPAEHVISKAIAPVRVDRPNVSMPSVTFVSSIALISPVDGVYTSRRPVLKWSTYPGAAFYTLSLISRPVYNARVTLGVSMTDGYQCWTRSRISATSVEVSLDGFNTDIESEESGRRSLLPGGCYTWVVFAHDKNGCIISSSERYSPDRESIFFVKPDGKKGG